LELLLDLIFWLKTDSHLFAVIDFGRFCVLAASFGSKQKPLVSSAESELASCSVLTTPHLSASLLALLQASQERCTYLRRPVLLFSANH